MATYLRPDGGNVELTPAVEKILKVYASGSKGREEAGGLFLGRLVLGSNDIVIDRATEPAAKDKRRAFTFWRSKPSHQKQVDLAWAKSQGTEIYLGEWHTHPEPVPTPSGQDEKNWLTITRTAKYEQESLIFAIAGYTRIRLWQVTRGSAEPHELLPQD